MKTFRCFYARSILITAGTGLVLIVVTYWCAAAKTTSTATQHTAGASPSACSINRKWHIPTYQGLTLGKSMKIDVERRFGKPIWSGAPEEKLTDDPSEDELLYEYENVGGVKGRTTVVLGERTGVVKAIDIYPQQLSMKKVIEQYGKEYIERESSLGPCPSEDEIRNFRPLREREYPIFLVYPQLGMYISVQKDGTVLEIGYLVSCFRLSAQFVKLDA